MNFTIRYVLSALLFFGVILALSGVAVADDTLVLIAPGQPLPTIYVAEKQSAPEKLAAQELKTYLEKMTGRDIKIIEWGRGKRKHELANQPKGVYIAIGQSALTTSLDTSELGTEQFIIEVTPGRLAIVGGPDRQRGVLYGVYEILEQAGYRMFVAVNGLQAVDVFKEKHAAIDLVLLDVVMPGLSGRSAFERIREVRPDVPVLFSSGYSANLLEVEFIQEVRAQLIHKPYDPEELLGKIRDILDQV